MHTRPRQIQTTEDTHCGRLEHKYYHIVPQITSYINDTICYASVSLIFLFVESVSVFIGITTTTKPSSSLKGGTNRLKKDSFILIRFFFFTCIQAFRARVTLLVSLTTPHLHELGMECVQHLSIHCIYCVGKLPTQHTHTQNLFYCHDVISSCY